MPELVQILWMLIGLAGARYADSGLACAGGECPAVPSRPVVAWAVPQTVRADEVHLFSRAERRPGQPGIVLVLESRGPREAHDVSIVGPAPIRLRTVLTTHGR